MPGWSSRPLQRRTDRQEGAAALEFAIILIPFCLLLFGMIQYGMFFYSYQTAKSTASSLLRQFTVGNCQDSTAMYKWANNLMAGATTQQLTATDSDLSGGPDVSTVWTSPTGVVSTTAGSPAAFDSTYVGGSLQLTLTYHPLNMQIPLVPFLSGDTFQQQVTGRVEDTTDNDPGGCPA